MAFSQLGAPFCPTLGTLKVAAEIEWGWMGNYRYEGSNRCTHGFVSNLCSLRLCLYAVC